MKNLKFYKVFDINENQQIRLQVRENKEDEDLTDLIFSIEMSDCLIDFSIQFKEKEDALKRLNNIDQAEAIDIINSVLESSDCPSINDWDK